MFTVARSLYRGCGLLNHARQQAGFALCPAHLPALTCLPLCHLGTGLNSPAPGVNRAVGILAGVHGAATARRLRALEEAL
jgi:hypothetical protein